VSVFDREAAVLVLTCDLRSGDTLLIGDSLIRVVHEVTGVVDFYEGDPADYRLIHWRTESDEPSAITSHKHALMRVLTSHGREVINA
jgi:hypothetical protein